MHLADQPELTSAFVKIRLPDLTTHSIGIQRHYKQARLQFPSSVGSAWLADFLGLLP